MYDYQQKPFDEELEFWGLPHPRNLVIESLQEIFDKFPLDVDIKTIEAWTPLNVTSLIDEGKLKLDINLKIENLMYYNDEKDYFK